MLYASAARSEAYKEIINKIKIGAKQDNIYWELTELCENCRPTNPLMCVELCQIWQLKSEYRKIAKTLTRPEFMDVLTVTRNDLRLKILEALMDKPCSMRELYEKLKARSHKLSLTVLSQNYLRPLVDLSLVRAEENLHTITSLGMRMYNIVTKSELAKLPERFTKYDETILTTLSSGPKSYHELAKTVPQGSLAKKLKRLQTGDLITASKPSSRIYYYRAKRRPTRKLSPTEMKIFKALPKEGISVRDLSRKVDLSVGTIYKHLRRLRYKRHVKKGKKTTLYNLTSNGRIIIQAFNIAQKFLF